MKFQKYNVFQFTDELFTAGLHHQYTMEHMIDLAKQMTENGNNPLEAYFNNCDDNAPHGAPCESFISLIDRMIDEWMRAEMELYTLDRALERGKEASTSGNKVEELMYKNVPLQAQETVRGFAGAITTSLLDGDLVKPHLTTAHMNLRVNLLIGEVFEKEGKLSTTGDRGDKQLEQLSTLVHYAPTTFYAETPEQLATYKKIRAETSATQLTSKGLVITPENSDLFQGFGCTNWPSVFSLFYEAVEMMKFGKNLTTKSFGARSVISIFDKLPKDISLSPPKSFAEFYEFLSIVQHLDGESGLICTAKKLLDNFERERAVNFNVMDPKAIASLTLLVNGVALSPEEISSTGDVNWEGGGNSMAKLQEQNVKALVIPGPGGQDSTGAALARLYNSRNSQLREGGGSAYSVNTENHSYIVFVPPCQGAQKKQISKGVGADITVQLHCSRNHKCVFGKKKYDSIDFVVALPKEMVTTIAKTRGNVRDQPNVSLLQESFTKELMKHAKDGLLSDVLNNPLVSMKSKLDKRAWDKPWFANSTKLAPKEGDENPIADELVVYVPYQITGPASVLSKYPISELQEILNSRFMGGVCWRSSDGAKLGLNKCNVNVCMDDPRALNDFVRTTGALTIFNSAIFSNKSKDGPYAYANVTVITKKPIDIDLYNNIGKLPKPVNRAEKKHIFTRLLPPRSVQKSFTWGKPKSAPMTKNNAKTNANNVSPEATATVLLQETRGQLPENYRPERTALILIQSPEAFKEVILAADDCFQLLGTIQRVEPSSEHDYLAAQWVEIVDDDDIFKLAEDTSVTGYMIHDLLCDQEHTYSFFAMKNIPVQVTG